MSARTSQTRHSIIISMLRKHPATLKDISERLAQQGGLTGEELVTTRKTFKRDQVRILETYGIEITYDRPAKVYHIANDSKAEASERLLEAFDITNALNLTGGSMQYIHFEARCPAGTENIPDILHAIKNRLLLNFSYQKHWDNEPNQRNTEPYAIKEFKNSWYLIAKDLGNGYVKSFALDRLTNLKVSKKHFNPSGNDVEEQFKDCFGIMSPNADKPSKVVLIFDDHQGKYIKAKPLHISQVVTQLNEDELKVELNIYITHDFIMELLAYGEKVTVISPPKLKAEMENILQMALDNYR